MEQTKKFNFFQHWYPLSPLEDIDPQQPTVVKLLGRSLVIWKPKFGKNYRVFLNQCPHRLAPLSEGRIDEKSGNLMCSYHGWQFNEQGQCTHIPQTENAQLVLENQQNLCATALPTREEQGLLWVWADPYSAELASIVPLPLSPQVDAEKGFVWSSYVRDLEYDWQTLVENVADPSHVPFAHHGIQGNRERAKPIPIEIVLANMDLIEAKVEGGMRTSITFEPPCRLEYAISFGPEGQQMGLVTYCIPVSPGKSRIVAQFPRNFAKTLHRLTPRWWDHQGNRNLVLDGDMILLHYQESFLEQRREKENWKTAYKLPTSADRLVIEFRKWFDRYCQGKLPWKEVGINPSAEAKVSENRQVILDRYQQHTQHCQSCRKAIVTIQRLQVMLLAYFALSVAFVSAIPDRLPLVSRVIIMVTALVGLGIYSWLKFKLEPKFYFVDYIHSQR
jgi:phenylpropionate dioxygenase-like ring-hydroxylating dioxygenase large terminal subunit